MPASVIITQDMRDNYAKYIHLAITITLKPKLYKFKPLKQLSQTVTTIFHLLVGYNYTCYPELTKSDNLHYHLYLNVPNTNNFDEIKLSLHDKFRDLQNIGFVDIKQLNEFEDRERWYQYISKDVDKSIRLIPSTHIKDDFNICSCKYTLLCLPYKSLYL